METTSLHAAVASVFNDRLPELLRGAFEVRSQQVEMALRVTDALAAERLAVIEAETGLGKSLAYLVPAVVFCRESGRRAVVSTHTRNLQRQLIVKDFPLALSAAGGGVKGAVLMGRANYACRRGIESVLKMGRAGLGSDELAQWLRDLLASETGELESIPGGSRFLSPELRATIACPARETVCARCPRRSDCFMFAARKRALEADVVMVNHALLFSDAAASGALLGPFSALVVDEAHHLEDVATDFFTLRYSPYAVKGAHDSVYSPECDETIAYARAIVAQDSETEAKRVEDSWTAFLAAAREADGKTAELFRVLDRNFREMARRWTREWAESRQVTYGEGAPLLYGGETIAAEISRALARMESSTADIVEVVRAFDALGETGVEGTVRSMREAAGEALARFEFLTTASAEDHVFYVRADESMRVSELAASPVDVSPRLGALLEDSATSAILTSATLAVDGDFSYTLDRLGLARSARASVERYESPFDLAAQRAVLLAPFLPDPSEEIFLVEAARVMRAVAISTRRRMLVLCTAKSQVSRLSALLSGEGEGAFPVFAQTEGGSRVDLLDSFRRSAGGVLIGLASFWEGIDLPGELLEVLVILKLPFLVPGQPVVQARTRRVVDAGEDAFERMFIPDVVLKLRQGMGRLIRTGSDRGAVIILDRRLWHSHYGESVLRAVTKQSTACDTLDEMIERLSLHFGNTEQR